MDPSASWTSSILVSTIDIYIYRRHHYYYCVFYYSIDYIPNGSDHSGRYTYAAQPSICEFNIIKLSEAFRPFVNIDESNAKKIYRQRFESMHLSLIRKKLALSNFNSNGLYIYFYK